MTASIARRWTAHLGSLRTTLALFALLGVVIFARPDRWGLGLALGALALNLLAALVVHPVLRRQLPLLVAHLALLVLVVGVGVGRLMALDGRFELTEGVPFDGTLLDQRSGPLHRPALHRLAFVQQGFEIDYAPGRRRGATRNTVTWTDADGQARQAVIGDHRPLVLDGYRLYTSPNKGFAPILVWHPVAGEPLRGSVHLPSFPVHELAQSRRWSLPGGPEVWVQLALDETLIDPGRADAFRLPGAPRLVVRSGDQRAELAPGGHIALPGGTLVFESLRSWMGYRVTYDPTLPWLLAASLVASLALGWHYAVKLRAPASTTAAAALRVRGADA